MTQETITIPAVDRTVLSVEAWVPAQPKAVVQIAHGMAEHAARYADLAERLNTAGYAVYASDHRGHGKTAGAPERLGVFAPAHGWSVAVRDLRSVTEEIHRRHPGLPVVLLGHSMGSALARDFAIRYGDRIDALVLTGVVGPLGAQGPIAQRLARREAKRHGRTTPSRLLDRLSFGSFNRAFRPNRTGFDWLSRDDAEVDAYVADPACGFVASAGFFDDMISGVRRVHRDKLLRRIPRRLPVWLASGAEDPLARRGRVPEHVAKQLTAAGLADVTTVIYPGARHELFHETNRAAVGDDLIAWLDTHLPAPRVP